MKKNVFILIVMGFVGLAMAACNKDKNDENKPVTDVDLITSATWKIDTIGFDADRNGQIDMAVPGGLQPCQWDNTLSFSADSTGVFSEGASKCAVSDPQDVDFGWNFSENNTIVNIEGTLPGGLTGAVNVLTLTSTSLILAKPVTTPVDGNLIISLKK